MAGAVLLLFAHALYYNYTADDAFITFRYVRNLLSGNGLIYNPGERVEGYTNFLWAMLLALPAWLGVRIEVAARALGMFFGACTLVLSTVIAHRWTAKRTSSKHPLLISIPAVLLAASGPFAMWTLGGLETVFFTFLLTLATYIYFFAARRYALYMCGVLFALLTMTRPDGILFLGAALAHVVVFGGFDGAEKSLRQRLNDSACLIASFSAVYLPYFVWRYAYYGYFFPNTFYAKVGGGPDFLVRGIKYVWLFISTYGFVPAAAAALYSYARMQSSARRQQKGERGIALFLFLQISLYLLFIVAVGGDQLVMKRFFVPLLPALYLLSYRGILELVVSVEDDEGMPSQARLFVVSAIGVLLIITALPSFAGREHDRVFNAEKPADADRKIIGQWLDENVPKDASIALVPAGIIPYYSGLNTIDLVGLNDAHIAHAPVAEFGKGEAGHEKHDSAYVLERRPDLIFLGACRIWPQKFKVDTFLNYCFIYGKLVPGNRELLQLEGFKEAYAPCTVKIDSGYVHFFKRNDFLLPMAEPLAPAARAQADL